MHPPNYLYDQLIFVDLLLVWHSELPCTQTSQGRRLTHKFIDAIVFIPMRQQRCTFQASNALWCRCMPITVIPRVWVLLVLFIDWLLDVKLVVKV